MSLRLSDKEYEDLEKLSLKTERSLNDLVRVAIRQYINKELASLN